MTKSHPPGGCPEGFHGEEGDESDLCYSDDIPCPESLEMKEFENAEGYGCTSPPWCEQLPDAWNCVSKETFCNSDAGRYQEHRVYCITSEPDRCNPKLEGSRCKRG